MNKNNSDETIAAHEGKYGDHLTFSRPKCLMEFCKVILTFEFADEIL